jgi:hypothetical protein
MLTLFPSLLTFSFFAPTLLRLAVALVFFLEMRGLRAHPSKKRFGVLSGIIGLFILAGAWTQLAAIAGLAYVAFAYVKKEQGSLFLKTETTLLALAILASLLALGAGAAAFDLPF